MRTSSFAALVSVLVSACASSSIAPLPEEAPTAPTTPVPPPEPTAAASAAAGAPTSSGSAAEADPDIPPPAAKPKSAWAVDGVSLSDIDGLALAAAFKKAKLTANDNSSSSPGNGWDTVGIAITGGKVRGRFYMVRPATVPTKKTSTGGPEVASSLLDKEKGFGVWDKDADVYFEIGLEEGGRAADAKRMLEQVIKRR